MWLFLKEKTTQAAVASGHSNCETAVRHGFTVFGPRVIENLIRFCQSNITFAPLSAPTGNLTLWDMDRIATTMPEARYRTTKKVRAASPAPSSAAAPRLHLVPAKKEKAADKAADKANDKAKKAGSALAVVWPVAVALFLSGFSTEWHVMATQAGVWALRFTFPYSMLASLPAFGLSGHMAATLPGLLIYGQLPLDGVLMTVMLARGKGLKSSIAQILLIHAVCTLVLWLVSFGGR